MVEEPGVGQPEVFGLADIDTGETLHAEAEVIVGVGPVYHPPAVARGASPGVAPSPMELREIGVFDAHELELAPFGKLRPAAVPFPLEAHALRRRPPRHAPKPGHRQRGAHLAVLLPDGGRD